MVTGNFNRKIQEGKANAKQRAPDKTVCGQSSERYKGDDGSRQEVHECGRHGSRIDGEKDRNTFVAMAGRL